MTKVKTGLRDVIRQVEKGQQVVDICLHDKWRLHGCRLREVIC